MKLIYSAVLALVVTSGMNGLLTACTDQNHSQAPSSTTINSGSMQGMDHGNMNHGNMDHNMTMDLGPTDANYDLRFIDAMSLHHRGAIAMAKDAKQKSRRPEIKKLAENIIATQSREETELLQKWRKAWYPQAREELVAYGGNGKPTVAMSDQQQQSMTMAQDLGAADAEFDLRFINAMIPHHEGALTMAQDALKKSQRPEVKQLAQEILTSQQKEIDQMKQWRQAWYKQ